jgi:hypothetical protein
VPADRDLPLPRGTRKNLKKQLDRNVLSFAVPWRMFEEMEDNVEGSFLQKETWRALQAP